MKNKYACTEACGFSTNSPIAFMTHIEGCIHVARWIAGWATRMKARNMVARG